MCFIDRETCNFNLKSSEIFLGRETVLRVQGMKFHEKLFYYNFCDFLRKKMVHVVIDR